MKSKTESEVAALPKQKVYFGKEVEQAIIKYNTLTDDYERNRLYEAEIHAPLLKLCENVLNRFCFRFITEDQEVVKHDTLTHLLKGIHLYTEGKGKAYSYFSVSAKNYLIQLNRRLQKESMRMNSLDDFAERMERYGIHNGIDDNNRELAIPSKHSQEESEALLKYIVAWFQKNITRLFRKKTHQDCCLDVCKSLTLDEADWLDDMYVTSPIKNRNAAGRKKSGSFTGRHSFVKDIHKKHKDSVYVHVAENMRYYYKLLRQDFLNNQQSSMLNDKGILGDRGRRQQYYFRKLQKNKETRAKANVLINNK